MKKRIFLLWLFVFCCVLIAGVYYVAVYKKTQAGIAIACGDIHLKLSQEFLKLEKPTDIEKLDQYGCYANADGCACAKKDPQGQGIVFGISSTDNVGVAIPTKPEEQKNFLQSLGELMIANAMASTTVTQSMDVFKGGPRMILTSVLNDGAHMPTVRDMFFIHSGKLYDLTFQTNSASFQVYWPLIEKSSESVTFVK